VSRGGRLRLLGGELRGRTLTVTKGVRPTEARVREALFSIWGPRLAGVRFLDLFAGSGAVGLEAVSRGAAEAWLVESDPRVLRALRRGCEELAPGRCHTVRGRLPAVGGGGIPGDCLVGDFGLIFADPPYAFTDHAALLRAVAGWLARDGEMALEHSARVEPPAEASGLRRVDERRYGESCLAFYRFGITGG